MKYLQRRFSLPAGPQKEGPKTADWDEVFGRKGETVKYVECDWCEGKGALDGTTWPCSICDGTGRKEDLDYDERDCGACHGSGVVRVTGTDDWLWCPTCKGSGKVRS